MIFLDLNLISILKISFALVFFFLFHNLLFKQFFMIHRIVIICFERMIINLSPASQSIDQKLTCDGLFYHIISYNL